MLVEFAPQLRLLLVSRRTNFLSLTMTVPLLAVGYSGSSVTVSLDDVAALWLEHLDASPDPVQLR